MPTRRMHVQNLGDALRAPLSAVVSAIGAAVNRAQRKMRRRATTVSPVSQMTYSPGSASSSAPGVHLAYASWLEDGRRLRALRRATAPTFHASPASPPAPRISQQNVYLIGAPAPATLPLPAPTPISLPLGAEGATFATPATPAALPSDEPLWANDDLSQLPTSLDDVDKLTEAQRRLVFLRYLVRQRIYNEGFSAQQTPEQYLPHERQPGAADSRAPHDNPHDPRPQSDWN